MKVPGHKHTPQSAVICICGESITRTFARTGLTRRMAEALYARHLADIRSKKAEA